MNLSLAQSSTKSAGISLQQLAAGTPYAAYAYSYPHKTAYGPLTPRRMLADVWASEDRSALFLYLHIPFCEMRCGFCNLFTTANPQNTVVEKYIDALETEAKRIAQGMGEFNVARIAIGGGTPTYLNAQQLDRVLSITSSSFHVTPGTVSSSVEISPRTAEIDRLKVLSAFGVSRISMGVQSFVDEEVSASGRAQKNSWVETAIQRVRDLAFPQLNLDLIYGLPGQTVKSFCMSVERALRWRPEEMYLYPLYVRPLTGLARWGRHTEDTIRLDCYRAGRALLLANGYEQISMRMFRLAGQGNRATDPLYCCQDDGMVGVGCGARSYTRSLHYSNEFAVGAPGVKEIISSYISRSEDDFDAVTHGCELGEIEQRRRWVIKSLLRCEGLDLGAYRLRFGGDALEHLPELKDLEEAAWITSVEDRLLPTEAGLERSDAIGPWLFSDAVKSKMDAYELR